MSARGGKHSVRPGEIGSGRAYRRQPRAVSLGMSTFGFKNVIPIGEGYVSAADEQSTRPVVAIAEVKDGTFRACVINESGILEWAAATVRVARKTAK